MIKIGVYLPDHIKANVGGGYSYTFRLMRDLLAHPEGKRFVPVVFSKDNAFLKELGVDECVEIQKPAKKFSYPHWSVADKIGLKLGKLFGSKLTERLQDEVLADYQAKSTSATWDANLNTLKHAGIDAMFYFSYDHYQFGFSELDLPYIASIWDIGHVFTSPFPELNNRDNFAYRERVIRQYLSRASLVVSESDQGSRDLTFHYQVKPEQLISIPMFPSAVADMPESEADKSILNRVDPNGNGFFFFPGQFWAHKNHLGLLNAFKTASEKLGKPLRLVFTGSDKGNHKLVESEIERLGLTGKVVNAGFIPVTQLRALYAAAIGVVFPSYLGPTNMPILEALYCGCPLACSDFDGHREQAGNAALYFDPADADSIAKAMISLADDSAGVRGTLLENMPAVVRSSRAAYKDALQTLMVAIGRLESKIKTYS